MGQNRQDYSPKRIIFAHNFKMKNLRSYIFTILIFTIFSQKEVFAETFDSKKTISELRELYSENNFKTLISVTEKILNNSTKNDTLSAYAAVYKASAYLTLSNQDSVKYYLSLADSFNLKEDQFQAFLCSTKASFNIRFDMNYVKAMEYYKKNLEYYKKNKDTINQILGITNIALIYYLRKDTIICLEWTKKAYDLANTSNNAKAICYGLFSMAQMNYTYGMFDEAMKYAQQVISLINETDEFDLRYLLTDMYIVKGSINLAQQKYDEAYRDCLDAKNNLSEARKWDKSSEIRLKIFNGDCLYYKKEYDSARELYLQSLGEAGKGRYNRQRIYERLYKTYIALENDDSAFWYYRNYNNITDSVFNFYSEREFRELMLRYEKEKYQTQLQQSETKILKGKKTITILLLTIIPAAVALLSLIFIYKRKNRKYTQLVKQYQELVIKDNREKELKLRKLSSDEKSTGLFKQIEKLMSEDKIYRDSTMSLEKLSEIVGSNRTYVSGVINKYSGKTVSAYINSYRIAEAIQIMSDPGNDIVMKALFMEVGFNSKSSFYRIFQNETGCTPSVYMEKSRELLQENATTERNASKNQA